MNKKLLLVLFFVCFSFFALYAQLSMTVTITSGTVVYNNNGTATWIDGNVVVRRASTDENPYFTVDLLPRADEIGGICLRNTDWMYYSTSGTSSKKKINNAEVYVGKNHSTSSNVLKTWDASGIGDNNVVIGNVLQGNFAKGKLTASKDFCAVFWSTTTLGAGFYELPIIFRLRQEQFAASGPTTEPIETSLQVLRFVVGTTASIYFKSGTSEIFELAFDELTALIPKDFSVDVQANFNFYLTVQSKNKGKLVHKNYPSETIPYSLVMKGISIPLTSSYKFSTKYDATGFRNNEEAFNSTITIGDISTYTAGRYEDILTFTVTAN